MSNPKEYYRAISFWNNLFEALSDTEGLSNQEIIEALKEDGIDAQRSIARVKFLIESEVEERRLAWRVKARTLRERQLKAWADFKATKHSPESFKQFLTSNTQLSESQIQIYHRKFEEKEG